MPAAPVTPALPVAPAMPESPAAPVDPPAPPLPALACPAAPAEPVLVEPPAPAPPSGSRLMEPHPATATSRAKVMEDNRRRGIMGAPWGEDRKRASPFCIQRAASDQETVVSPARDSRRRIAKTKGAARAAPQKNEGIRIFWETDVGAPEGAGHTSAPLDLADTIWISSRLKLTHRGRRTRERRATLVGPSSWPGSAPSRRTCAVRQEERWRGDAS